MLHVPGPKRSKLKHDKLLSNVAYKFNLRRYSVDRSKIGTGGLMVERMKVYNAFIKRARDQVGWCRLKPVFASTEQNALCLGSLIHPPVCVTLWSYHVLRY